MSPYRAAGVTDAMNAAGPAAAPARTVYVVDDDDAVRDSLEMLFRTAGLRVEAFASATAFLSQARASHPCCLVLDIRMPDMSGLALQDALLARGARVPVIFITGHGDIPTAVDVVKKGAFDFIEKPFDDFQLLCRVLNALDISADNGVAEARQQDGAERFAQLSEREREVLALVLEGKSSRQAAAELFISIKTVEFHRARIMQKLGVGSVAELFRLCLNSQSGLG
jgi:FixJ family two-component response regulator